MKTRMRRKKWKMKKKKRIPKNIIRKISYQILELPNIRNKEMSSQKCVLQKYS
jgi:hypothetical protein